jgi:hypothetical protein
VAQLDTALTVTELPRFYEEPGVFARAGERLSVQTVTDPGSVPGLRWELLGFLSEFSPCMGPTRILFGPGSAYEEALESVRSELADQPGEKELLRMFEEAVPRRLHYPPDAFWTRTLYSLSRLSGAVFRNERIPSCTLLSLEALEDW